MSWKINFSKWILRTFFVISKEEALHLGLSFQYNIYGDAINYLNCRSIWIDSKGRQYRVKELINTI